MVNQILIEYGNVKSKYLATELDKKVHKLISRMRYFETISIPLSIDEEMNRKKILAAIRKSAEYNCMEVQIKWHKSSNEIQVTAEGM